MGKKKTGKDKEKTKEKKEEKKKRKDAKALKTAKKRAGKEAKIAGEEDIEAILAEIQKKEAEKTAVTVEILPIPPSPRANFSLTPTSNEDFIMFGGEYFDGESNTVYNDVFRWNVETGEWRQIISPNTPPPRCSHQAVLYRDHLYVFGGEFATVDQFYHYRDLWRFDLRTNAWEKLDLKGTPSARSGHRVCVWRNYLVLFGGFYEAYRETKWFGDLHILSFADHKWKKIEFPPHKMVPGPRSGCQLALHQPSDTIYMYGGYTKLKKQGEKAEGHVYTDLWALNMGPLAKGGEPHWEKVRSKGQVPSARSGAVMAVHRNRALLFGGVVDEEGHRHTMTSTFYNELYALDMDRKRWFQLGLRKQKTGGRRRRKKNRETGEGDEGLEGQDESEGGSSDDSDAEDSDEEAKIENQFAYIDASGNVVYVKHEEEEEKDSENATNEGSHTEKTKEDAEEVQHYTKESGNNPSTYSERDESKEDGVQTHVKVQSTTEEEEKKEEPVPQVEQTSEISEKTQEETQQEQQEQEEDKNVPLPRINGALLVKGHYLYVYGGVLEVDDREITLDDCWRLDLNKMAEWEKILEGTMDQQEWKGDESDHGSSYVSSDEDFDDEDDLDDFDGGRDYRLGEIEEAKSETEEDAAKLVQLKEDEEEKKDMDAIMSRAMSALGVEDEKEEDAQGNGGGEEEKKKKKKKDKDKKEKDKKKKARHARRKEVEELRSQLELDDADRTPQLGENLREFFQRTQEYWTRMAMELPGEDKGPMREKELKREGFQLAQARFEELRPILDRLNELEEEQREAEEKANSGSSKRRR